MLAARIYSEGRAVDERLRAFGVTRAELLTIVHGVVSARADVVEDDPVTAEGTFAYMFGTRYLRQVFRSHGWLWHRKDNIEAVRHPERTQTVVYQNVDVAASVERLPRAISGKGAGSDRLVSGQPSLFPVEELEARLPVHAGGCDRGVWYFCVSVDGDDVCAELSLPSDITGGNFGHFVERIFVLRPGEWGELIQAPTIAEGNAVELEPIVTRK